MPAGAKPGFQDLVRSTKVVGSGHFCSPIGVISATFGVIRGLDQGRVSVKIGEGGPGMAPLR